MKPMELCVPCAEEMKESYEIAPVKNGKNMKITCARCKRRRFGVIYEVRRKQK